MGQQPLLFLLHFCFTFTAKTCIILQFSAESDFPQNAEKPYFKRKTAWLRDNKKNGVNET